MNPLLNKQEFIPFNKITPEFLDEALQFQLNSCKDVIKHVCGEAINPTWSAVVEPLHQQLYQLNQYWGVLNHLMSVMDNNELRELHNKWLEPISNFYVDLGQNKQLYERYQAIKHESTQELTNEQQKVLDNEIRDFYLSGINLPPEIQQQLKQVENNLSELSTKFEQNVLDATDSWVKYVNIDELAGIPADILTMYKDAAVADGKGEGVAKITLHAPNYIPIMQYCDNRVLREELYKNYLTRASEFGDATWNNTPIIQQILSLRHQKAQMLKFKNYTELSLYTKMANSQQEVLDFLTNLAEKSRNQALQDLEELTTFSTLAKLEAWDIAYFSEKLQEQKYSYSNNELKQYFQQAIVLDGLFKLIKHLYNVELTVVTNIPLWHKDVTTYMVTRNNEIIGYLYMDLCARTGKRSGAWMDSAQDKFIGSNYAFKPIAYIVCNFASPVGNKPALLTFDDVQTLFHEMGHALHHLLSKINYHVISGINGVEWDAVELPSQFMEQFVWNYATLSTLSKHVDNGEILPLGFYNKLLNARYFQAGLQMLRQLEFSIYDLLLHSEFDMQSGDYLQLLARVRQQIAVFVPPNYNRFPNSFTHIFAGGYASGYYSYKWAEVLACDVFSVFDGLDPSQYAIYGAKFLDNILSMGGLNSMSVNFKRFMGREPKIDALLKYSGVQQS